MPRFVVTQRFPVGREELFAILSRPEQVVALAPPTLGLSLLSATEPRGVSARTTIQAKRWGMSSIIETEVIEWLIPSRMVEVQRSGVFAAWRLERVIEARGENESEVTETIDYESPRGLLGLTLTPSRIEADLGEGYRWREQQLLARFLQG